MRIPFFAAPLAAVILLAGCQSSHLDERSPAAAVCAPGTPVVRTVADASGNLTYDAAAQQFRISVPQPGAVDVVDVGVVCGDLPATWQGVQKVTFSGTYQEYRDAPAAPAGYTLYHLALSKLAAQ